MTKLDFSVLWPFRKLLPAALGLTIGIGLAGFILALAIAIIVGSLRSRKLPKIISVILSTYVEVFRGTPLLVQLFFVYYGLPGLGFHIGPIKAAVITMGLNSGSYLSENIRAAILAVDKGQYEAAYILGYTPIQRTFHIILPQAIRVAIPSLMNGFSAIIKETSLVSVLPVVEITKLGNQVYARTYHPFEIYIMLGIIYFVLTYTVTFFAKWLERRSSRWEL